MNPTVMVMGSMIHGAYERTTLTATFHTMAGRMPSILYILYYSIVQYSIVQYMYTVQWSTCVYIVYKLYARHVRCILGAGASPRKINLSRARGCPS